MTAVTAKTRSQLRLDAVTELSPDAAIAAVKSATAAVKGGGVSLLTTGVQNVGAQVHVEAEGPGRLRLSINSGKRIVELCTFSAVASTNGDGKTQLRVGGLETYKSVQTKLWMLIPMGPKRIAGMAPYKAFLGAVEQAIRGEDTTAWVTIDGLGAA